MPARLRGHVACRRTRAASHGLEKMDAARRRLCEHAARLAHRLRRKVLLADVARHVLAVEDGRLKRAALDAIVDLLDSSLQVVEVLVRNPVGVNQPRDLGLLAPVRDQLRLGRDVNAVDVREADGRRGGREEDLGRARVTCHLHDLLGGRAAHDRVVDEQHILALKLALDRVELDAHTLLARGLARHDEGARDVPVLDEALTVRPAELVGERERGRARRVGHGYDDVDLLPRVRVEALDALSEHRAHAQARLVHGHAVHHRVGPRKVDVLEEARAETCAGHTLARERRPAALWEEDGFARRDVADNVEGVARRARDRVNRDALRRDRVVGEAVRLLARAVNQRPDAERVAEHDDADVVDEDCDRIAANAFLEGGRASIKDGVGIEVVATLGAHLGK
mmetsp:Transcript_15957/g.49680  ORF Transcript_15957/g.49680 Transcript_15957/m.49680 type:complete len:396 (-) Transcript_15957:677-1864(-)